MAMGLTIPIMQVVGYQNSGKTTLLMKLIEHLSQEGMRIGTIKHHGHGGFPDFYEHDKDTAKHRQAGAVVTAVEGGGMLQIEAFHENGWSLPQMISFYEKLPIDFLLIEGFKKEPFPKIVLLKSEEETHLIDQLKNIQALICWYRPLPQKKGIPVFHLDDVNSYISWIKSYMERKDWNE